MNSATDTQSKMLRPPGPPAAQSWPDKIRLFVNFRRDMLGMVIKGFTKYGDFYMFQIDNYRQYITARPELIHELLVVQAANFRKARDYTHPEKGLARFMGHGLLTSDGEFWKRQRRLVAPAFHARRVATYASTMVDYTCDMLQTWRDGARLDISREFTGLTMKIVAKTLFNADVSADVARMGEAVKVMQNYTGVPRILPTWLPVRDELRARRALRYLDQLIYGVIQARRAMTAENEDKGDLLSMLLLAQDEDGSRMTDEQARDEVVTMFLAGHETTANTLNWTFYLLAQNPDAEAKLHMELDSVLGGRTPTLADLDRLKYTEMVIKESMRLYPPAWGVTREAITDLTLGDYKIPKGSVVAVVTYLVHRDPNYWPDAERFMPERFSAENEPNIPKYAYWPFGGGPRVCVGNAFAMMEARLLLATIASRYRLSLKPGQKVEMLPLITLAPKGGLPMTVQQRIFG